MKRPFAVPIVFASVLVAFVAALLDGPPIDASARPSTTSESPNADSAPDTSATWIHQTRADRAGVAATALTIEDGGFYRAAPGARFEYHVTLDSQLRFGSPDAAPVGIVLDGTQVTTVLDRRDDEVLAEIRYDVDAIMPGGVEGAAERTERELARPVLVCMKNDGSVLGLRFADGIGRRVADTVRALLSGHRFVVAPASRRSSSWESQDAEPHGVARFDYRWLDRAEGRLERTRADFTSDASLADVGGAPAAVGTATGQIDSELGWRTESAFEERIESVAGGLLAVTGESRGTLSLREHMMVAVSADCGSIWDGPWESLTNTSDLDVVGPQEFELRFWSHRLEGMTVNYLAARIEELLLSGESEQRDRLAAETDIAWMLRLDPHRIDEVRALLGAVSPETAQLLLSAVGRVGDAACQKVLVDTARDRGRTDDLRAAALFAIASVDHPDDELLGHMAALIADRGDDSAWGTSLLVGGALAGLTDKGDVLVDAIVAAQPIGGSSDQMIDWLTALANTKSPSVVSQIQGFVDHSDAEIAEAAAKALIHMAEEI